MSLSLQPVADQAQQFNNRALSEELTRLRQSGAFTLAPTTPLEGELWYDTISDSLKVWSGTAWVNVSNSTDRVAVTGDVMEGDLEFPLNGFIMNSATKRWRVTISDVGALSASEIVSTGTGSPVGLLLTITKP